MPYPYGVVGKSHYKGPKLHLLVLRQETNFKVPQELDIMRGFKDIIYITCGPNVLTSL